MIKNLYAFFLILAYLICGAALSHQSFRHAEEHRLGKEKALFVFKMRVEALLDSATDLRNIGNHSPLLDDRIFEFPDLLKRLIEQGIYADIKGHLNQTPLHRAINLGKLKSVSILLEAGADPNYIPNYFTTNAAPLEKAISHGNLELVKELLKFGADPRTISSHGNTLIMEAFARYNIFLNLGNRNNRIAIVEELVNAGADPMQLNKQGLDCLMFAGKEFFSFNLKLTPEKVVSNYKQDYKYLLELMEKINNNDQEGLEKESCSICYEEFALERLVNPCVTCKLQYCIPCINAWSKKSPTCPTCKELINVKADAPSAIKEMDDWLFMQEVD